MISTKLHLNWQPCACINVKGQKEHLHQIADKIQRLDRVQVRPPLLKPSAICAAGEDVLLCSDDERRAIVQITLTCIWWCYYLHVWDSHRASVSVSKRITRKFRPVQVPYILNESALTVTPYEKDLGVWVASDLTWSKHITKGCAKDNKLLSFLRRTTLDISSVRTHRTLYLAVVHPALGYTTQVWSPQTVKLIDKLERIQRRATKYILGLPFLCAESLQKNAFSLPIYYLCAIGTNS